MGLAIVETFKFSIKCMHNWWKWMLNLSTASRLIPKWHQNCSKWLPNGSQMPPKFLDQSLPHDWSRKLAPRWPQNDPKMTPKWLQMAPKWLQDGFLCVRWRRRATKYVKIAKNIDIFDTFWGSQGVQSRRMALRTRKIRCFLRATSAEMRIFPIFTIKHNR